MPAPNYAMMINHVTEAALSRPVQNARHLSREQARARREVAAFEDVLDHLGPDDKERPGIEEDIAWVRGLPGYEEHPDLLEKA